MSPVGPLQLVPLALCMHFCWVLVLLYQKNPSAFTDTAPKQGGVAIFLPHGSRISETSLLQCLL